ncbi:hypothetical protein TNCV_1705622 [Trichonephila clavipes]|uniref:Uncharacterized protein n=1 Tax=Trichonephila clavipes TaxID=2585209 RepID=A0A8X6RAT4_TRICX|nr:hypothetical protein TNCV_1705622 [Trichonephila clavipes]
MVAADCNEHAVWFARSSDLSYMDFFFLGHMKSLAYSSSVEDLIALISVAAGRIRDIPGNFQNLRNSMQHYCLSYTPGLALHTTVAEKCPSSPEDEQKQGESRDSKERLYPLHKRLTTQVITSKARQGRLMIPRTPALYSEIAPYVKVL